MPDAIPFIDADSVFSALDDRALIDGMIAAHRRGIDDDVRVVLEEAGKGDASDRHFLVLPAWIHGEALGAKLVTSFPDNPAEGRPAVHAVYALFDGRTGAPAAMIDGQALTFRKTAIDSACGAHFLCRDDARTMLMVGAGDLAVHLVRAHRAARPGIARVLVWNRTGAKADALADLLQTEGIDAQPTRDLDAAVSRAELISCATGALRPLIKGALLKPGTHLDLVGGYTPGMREADDDCARLARRCGDYRKGAGDTCGDLAQPIADGVIAREAVEADLFDLAAGRHPGRTDEDAVTLYKNAGGGHLDLMAARLVVAGPAQGR